MSTIDFDDIEFEIDDTDDIFPVGKIASLPLEPVRPPSLVTTAPPYDLREGVRLVEDAKKLFDFTETKLSPVQQMYIISYATKGTKKGACELSGVSYAVVSRWLENEEFVQALQNAVGLVQDSLEEELIRRAMNGSDKLLVEAIKAHKPEKYQPRTSADINIHGEVVHTWAELAKQAKEELGEVKDVEFEEVESES